MLNKSERTPRTFSRQIFAILTQRSERKRLAAERAHPIVAPRFFARATEHLVSHQEENEKMKIVKMKL